MVFSNFCSELAQGLDTDKINPYIEKCFGLKKPLITVSKQTIPSPNDLSEILKVFNPRAQYDFLESYWLTQRCLQLITYVSLAFTISPTHPLTSLLTMFGDST